MTETEKTSDEPAKVTLREERTLWKGWSHLRQIVFDYQSRKGKISTLTWDVFDAGPAVAILLYNKARKSAVFVRQFRIPVHLTGDQPFLLEVPAGKTDGQDAAAAVLRETLEETGYAIENPRFLFSAYMSPGAVTEKIDFFFAEITDAQRVEAGGGLEEENEDLELLELPLAETYAMVESGEITDAKTIMLLQWAKLAGLV